MSMLYQTVLVRGMLRCPDWRLATQMAVRYAKKNTVDIDKTVIKTSVHIGSLASESLANSSLALAVSFFRDETKVWRWDRVSAWVV